MRAYGVGVEGSLELRLQGLRSLVRGLRLLL